VKDVPGLVLACFKDGAQTKKPLQVFLDTMNGAPYSTPPRTSGIFRRSMGVLVALDFGTKSKSQNSSRHLSCE
jgi:hypothetical protein